MKKSKKNIDMIVDTLKRMYPDAKAELDYENPFELMIAVVLSAQCTDVRVNAVTKQLFRKVKKPADVAGMSLSELEADIKSCGLYKTKAKNLIAACKMIEETFAGEVPRSFEELTSLPGVGRKSANVIMSNVFGVPAIAVDTHVFRVSNRIGIVKGENVLETEKQLMEVISRDDWSIMHHVLIFHGRRMCTARRPDCLRCPIAESCDYKSNN